MRDLGLRCHHLGHHLSVRESGNAATREQRRSVNANLLKGNLDLILLAIIEPAPIYGGEITREASERSNGYFDFKEGTLYPALHRLEKAGFIAGEFRYLPRGGSPVKFYQITLSGSKELSEQRKAQQAFGQAMNALLGDR
jgi:PadR family transcriptional regulator, regulatory protein PadR